MEFWFQWDFEAAIISPRGIKMSANRLHRLFIPALFTAPGSSHDLWLYVTFEFVPRSGEWDDCSRILNILIIGFRKECICLRQTWSPTREPSWQDTSVYGVMSFKLVPLARMPILMALRLSLNLCGWADSPLGAGVVEPHVLWVVKTLLLTSLHVCVCVCVCVCVDR